MRSLINKSGQLFSTYILLATFFFSLPLPVPGQNFFNNPESIAYDTLNIRYLISNVESGDIIQINPGADTTFFYTGLTRTLGMVIVDNILYVTDSTGVVGFDLATDDLLFTITINSMTVLNDITADTSGYLYVTDSGNGNIYRIKMSDQSYITIVSGIYWPNGILYDPNTDRILFCAFGNNVPIRVINRTTFAVSTIITTSFTNLDGLTMDNEGNIYVSSWGSNSVYRYDNSFTNPPELISSGHNGPADIFFNRLTNTLVIPNFNSNTVDFIQIVSGFDDDDQNYQLNNFRLHQNYPNPFNPTTTITYQIPEKSFVSLKVFDSLGKFVGELVHEEKSAGEFNVKFDGTELPSGVYLYSLQMGEPSLNSGNNFVQCKKMILMK